MVIDTIVYENEVWFFSHLYPKISKYQPIKRTHNINLSKTENAFGPESNWFFRFNGNEWQQRFSQKRYGICGSYNFVTNHNILQLWVRYCVSWKPRFVTNRVFSFLICVFWKRQQKLICGFPKKNLLSGPQLFVSLLLTSGLIWIPHLI